MLSRRTAFWDPVRAVALASCWKLRSSGMVTATHSPYEHARTASSEEEVRRVRTTLITLACTGARSVALSWSVVGCAQSTVPHHALASTSDCGVSFRHVGMATGV